MPINPTIAVEKDVGGIVGIEDSEWYRKLYNDVFGARKGGGIVVIDAEDARTGVAKTSAAVAFGKFWARVFGYDLREDDCVFSSEAAVQLYEDHPGKRQPSVIIWDEAVGAGSGDARRSMSEENLEIGRAFQTMRKKRVLSFVTLPDWGDLDKRLRKFADYRLWARRQPIGVVKPYEVATPFGSSEVLTRSLGPGDGEEIAFPNMDALDDHHYQSLDEAKSKDIIQAEGFQADEDQSRRDPDEVEREQAVKTVLKAVRPWDEDSGMTQVDAAKLVDYSRPWVNTQIQKYRDGEYQDLVEVTDV